MVLSGQKEEIVKVGIVDVPDIFHLWSTLIKDNTLEEKIREMVEDSRGRRDRVLLLKKNGNIGGFIAYNEKKGNGHIAGIGVKENRMGYGGRLLNAAENDLKNSGYAEIILEVSPLNLPAIGFYIQMGYVLFGEEQDYYGKGMKAFIFGKRLIK